MRHPDSLTGTHERSRALESALRRLLDCTELNLDEMEPHTIKAIRAAEKLLSEIASDSHEPGPIVFGDPGAVEMKQFRLRYARVVLMEVPVVAAAEEDIRDDGRLPEVYHGIDASLIGPHVLETADFEAVWEIRDANVPPDNL